MSRGMSTNSALTALSSQNSVFALNAKKSKASYYHSKKRSFNMDPDGHIAQTN